MFKNTCSSPNDNCSCLFAHSGQMSSTAFKYLNFRKAFKTAKLKRKQHENPSLEKSNKSKFQFSPGSKTVSPYHVWEFKTEQAE
jgi:hypothetical protein